MAEVNNYNALLTEIIAKQADVLGPDIAVAKARSVSELEVDDSGKVTAINGDKTEVLQKLVDQYIALSGQIVKNILGPVFDKYPGIKVTIDE